MTKFKIIFISIGACFVLASCSEESYKAPVSPEKRIQYWKSGNHNLNHDIKTIENDGYKILEIKPLTSPTQYGYYEILVTFE